MMPNKPFVGYEVLVRGAPPTAASRVIRKTPSRSPHAAAPSPRLGKDADTDVRGLPA